MRTRVNRRDEQEEYIKKRKLKSIREKEGTANKRRGVREKQRVRVMRSVKRLCMKKKMWKERKWDRL